MIDRWHYVLPIEGTPDELEKQLSQVLAMIQTVIKADLTAGPSEDTIFKFQPPRGPPSARSSRQGSGTLPSVSEEPGEDDEDGAREEEGDPASGPATNGAEDSTLYATRRMVAWVYTVRCVALCLSTWVPSVPIDVQNTAR